MHSQRRPFSSLLQLPGSLMSFLSQAHIVESSALLSSAELLPEDIILEIARHLSLTRDVLNMSLTSSHMRSVLLPILYASVDLRSSKECRVTLNFLAKRPDITRHIRELVLRPNLLEWGTREEALDELGVVRMVEQMAVNLPALQKFVWDGAEMPDDHLFLALRAFCLRLRHVGSVVGSKPLKPDSHLYDFNDLVGFSLIVKRNAVGTLDQPPPVGQFPDRLWEMLLNRSPHLEELTIKFLPECLRLLDMSRIASGRWPDLRRLSLGACTSTVIMETTPFFDFLSSHRNLESFSAGFWYPDVFYLPLSALPQLKFFSGIPLQVTGLPNPYLLKNLRLKSIAHSANMIPVIRDLLKNSPLLVSLSIWFEFNTSPVDHGESLHSLLVSCPQLSHLELSCSSNPSFDAAEFSTALRDSACLKTFILTKVQRSNDGDMVQSAAQIVRENPGLERLKLRYTFPWASQHEIRLKQVGAYEVAFNEHRKPASLLVQEWGLRFIRRGLHSSGLYRYDLLSSTGITGGE